VNARYLTLLMIWFLNGCLTAPLTTQLPVYVDASLHRPPLFTATLQAIQLGCGGVAALLGGAFADALGRKRTLVLGLTGDAVASLQFRLNQPFAMVLIAVYVGGAMGFQSIGGQSYLLSAVRVSSLGIGAAFYFLGNTLGSSLGNFLAGFAIDRVGFAPVALVITCCSALLVLTAARLLPPVPLSAQGREPVLAMLGSYRRLLRRGDVRLLCLLRYLTTFYWGAVTLLLPLLMFRLTGSKATAGLYAGVSLAVAASFQILTGRLSDRIGRSRPTVALSIAIPSAALLMGLFSGHVAGLFAAGLLGASAAWSLSTLMPGLIDDISEPSEKGRVLALTHSTWSFAMLSGSLMAGALVEVSAALPFFIAGAANVVSIGLAIALMRRRGHAPLSRFGAFPRVEERPA
jgi:MFS family permease